MVGSYIPRPSSSVCADGREVRVVKQKCLRLRLSLNTTHRLLSSSFRIL